MSDISVGTASEKEARDVAEHARETEWTHPSFVRALPRAIPSRPDSPASALRRGGRSARQAVHGQAARVHGAGGFRRDRPHRRDPRVARAGAARHGRLRHQDRQGVRRARSVADELHPRDRDGDLQRRIDYGAPLRPSVDRSSAAAQAVRHRRTEAQILSATCQGRDLGVCADRSRCGI